MRGGYVMIDCTGLDLIKGSTAQTINGLYAAVKSAMVVNKPIVAVNCNWDGKPVTPIYVMAIDFTTAIICTASTLQVQITPEDVVTIVNLAPAN